MSTDITSDIAKLKKAMAVTPLQKTDLRRFVVRRQGTTMGSGVLFPRIKRVAYQPHESAGSPIQNHPLEAFLQRMTRIGAVVSWME